RQRREGGRREADQGGERERGRDEGRLVGEDPDENRARTGAAHRLAPLPECRAAADPRQCKSFATSRIGRVERRIRARITAPSIAATISWARLRASRRSLPPLAR